MKVFFTATLLLLLLFVCTGARAAEDGFVGTWSISVDETSADMPWWETVKYPVRLRVTTTSGRVAIEMTDQYGFSCATDTEVTRVNVGRELVFSHCGAGTKHAKSWGPVHHAKIVDGRIEGVVTSDRYLFRWSGVRVP